MKNAISVSLIILSLISTSSIFAQKSKHDISFYLGYGIGSPDKRYDFLYDQIPSGPALIVIDKLNEATLDDEFTIGLRYNYALSNKVKIGFGIGYAQLVQDFVLPANAQSFYRLTNQIFLFRDISHYHMIQLSPSIDVNLFRNNAFFGINVTSTNNVSFRKEIKAFNLSRNKLEFFASELYSGIYAEYKRIRTDLGFRVLHLKFRDDAIANNGLNPDTYNPLKMRFQLSYVLW